MQKSRIHILVILVLAAVIGGGLYFSKQSGMRALADKELAAQRPERAEDARRLAIFYHAYARYVADHKGAAPPSIEALFPKYLSDPRLLVSPTAQRWSKVNPRFAAGTVAIGGREYPETYGFRWSIGGFPRLVKRLGDSTPLIVSDSEQEGMYRAVYHHPPSDGQFSDEGRMALIPEVANTQELGVRLNGRVEEIPAADM
jgi:hypothetical protein